MDHPHSNSPFPPLSTQLLVDFPELSHLSREDLEDLLNDPNYFQAIVHSLPRVKAMFQAQSELGSANESIAQRNLSLQDDLYRLRAETQQAFDECRSLQVRWKEVEREQKDLYQRLDPSFLLLRLKHSTTAQDDLSETLASSFIRQPPPDEADLHGKDIDEFVKQFKELRKTYHKRTMWGDQWASGKVSWRED